MPRLLRDLEGLICGATTARDLLRERAGARAQGRERASPAVSTEIVIPRPGLAPAHHRRGSRATVRALARGSPRAHELGLDIALSRLGMEGTRVADVFYVNERDGAKVAPGERFKQIRERLRIALSEEAR